MYNYCCAIILMLTIYYANILRTACTQVLSVENKMALTLVLDC